MAMCERLEMLPSYSALNTCSVCVLVLWGVLSNLSRVGHGRSTIRNAVCAGGEPDTRGGHE